MLVRICEIELPLLAVAPVTLPAGKMVIVQANVVVGVVLVRAILVVSPEQIDCADGVAVTIGVGFTNTVAVI
jgi:hypothetical protein